MTTEYIFKEKKDYCTVMNRGIVLIYKLAKLSNVEMIPKIAKINCAIIDSCEKGYSTECKEFLNSKCHK